MLSSLEYGKHQGGVRKVNRAGRNAQYGVRNKKLKKIFSRHPCCVFYGWRRILLKFSGFGDFLHFADFDEG